jgi:hypothetical protein
MLHLPPRGAAVLLLLALPLGEAQGQVATTTVPATSDTVVLRAIGSRYSAGWLQRQLFGSDYRSLWTTPIPIPVLDLATYSGGLTAVSRGGGQQTTSLRFHAASGGDYYFRSIDKDPTPNLPPELRGTAVAGVVQDQTSSSLPTVPLIVAPLLSAAGVLHGEPELFILPDDERLGEFRGLAGLIGMLEPRIAGTWGGATEIINGDELFKRIEQSPDDRVDVRALLTARLLDILVGDWDRHRDQWSWARFGDALPHRWVPIPRDRDFAMVGYDGLILHLARIRLPQLIEFGPKYPEVLGLTWNGRELDRHFLLEAERPVWDSAVAEVQAAITDSVIEAAVRRLPDAHYALIGPRLVTALKQRRDALGSVANRFYRMLAEQAEVYATDAGERATVTTIDPRTIEVTLARADSAGDPVPTPYYRRRFSRSDTRELRLFLGGGGDTVEVGGKGRSEIAVRVIGGDGADLLLDSARVGGVRMYDADRNTVVVGGAPLDRRAYTPPPKRTPTEIPPRDWGHRVEPAGLLAGGPDIGILFGVGRTLTVYGFRKLPYASEHRFRAGIATGPWTYRADYRGRFRWSDSPVLTQVSLRASGIDVLSFNGFGNEIAAPRGKQYYRVTQQEYEMELGLVAPRGNRVELSVGPVARYVRTDNRPNRFLATLNPYGSGNFGEVGVRATISLDSRRVPNAATTGVRYTVGGSAYPGWWNVTRAYGEVHSEVTGYLRLRAPLDPGLLLRAGGKKIWGPYPYFDAAFIGNNGTVRLGRANRYAGDASAYGTAELHLRLGHVVLLGPSDFGVMGLADAGRVYLAGEQSNTWHGAAGGGIWLSILDRANTVSLAVAKSEERTAFYFQAGFGF